MKEKLNSNQETPPDISRFLLEDTQSLRNEIDFTKLADMIHPLTYTEDLKKHETMRLIPVMDKYQDERFKKLVHQLLD